MAKKCAIVGNWKMYKTQATAKEYFGELIDIIKGSEDLKALVALALPYTLIQPVKEWTKQTPLWIGAQNMHNAEEGAFTGEIALPMLQEVGADFVILGHSERRHYLGESNTFINAKVKTASKAHFPLILCIGETEQERSSGKTEAILKSQLTEGLEGVTLSQMDNVWIAYEPVWAIGTGKVAGLSEIEATHTFIREVLKDLFSDELLDRLHILYGGSVKPESAKEILSLDGVDGVLVGGASLDPKSFSSILSNGLGLSLTS